MQIKKSTLDLIDKQVLNMNEVEQLLESGDLLYFALTNETVNKNKYQLIDIALKDNTCCEILVNTKENYL